MSPPNESGTINADAIRKESDEWLELSKIALDEWCENNGIKPKIILRDELDIPKAKWEAIAAAKGFTDVELYARIFQHTGLPQFDPRSVPPRVHHVPRPKPHLELKIRAWSEEKYNEWLAERNTPKDTPTTGAPTQNDALPVTEHATLPSPAQQADQVQPRTVDQRSHSKSFRQQLEQAFDQLLEKVASATIPRKPDHQDNQSVEATISALYWVFENVAKMGIDQRSAFAKTHGRQLTLLLPYVEAFSIPDEKKRENALSMMMSFNALVGLTKD